MVTTLALVFGVLLLIGAVAGFVIVPEHQPGTEVIAGPPSDYRTGDACANYTPQDQCEPRETIRVGFTRTEYDGARIGTWAALIIGGVLVLLGLIRFAQRSRPHLN